MIVSGRDRQIAPGMITALLPVILVSTAEKGSVASHEYRLARIACYEMHLPGEYRTGGLRR